MQKPIILSIATVACFASVAFAAAPKPNFLFIIADDCTFRDIGCYGGQAHTPNIDRLASEGMKFKQCFQSAPMCSPTRHNIYTGLYPVKSGAYPNHTFVKDGTKSVVHYLKPLGYRVALSGKHHISPRESFPFEYSGKDNNPDLTAIDLLLSECKASETPFCLFACSNEPHSPWNKGDASRYPPAKVTLPPYFVDTRETREDMSKYLAEITYYDWQVGECLKLLEKHGVAENTLVVVVSEQGSSFPFGKWTCYDTGLQSACIARWPGHIEAGSVSDALIEYIDILPTFVDAAGGKPAAALQGKSLLPVLSGEKSRHKDFVFGEMTTRGIINGSPYFGIRSVRSDKFKYIINFTPDVTFTNACTKSGAFKSWEEKADAGDADAADKVRRYYHRPAEELYAITEDTYEWNNLAADPKFAEVKAELRDQLDAWMLAQGDKGQETELAALEHQGRGATENADAAPKKKRKKR
ncbi:MAG: sulfatase [Planctomycetia bacterium]|nr:sulfatase [Planctomycetia bacterium]